MLLAGHVHGRRTSPSRVCTPFPTALFCTEQGEKDFGAAEDAVKECSVLGGCLGMKSESVHDLDRNEMSLARLSLKSLKLVQWLLRLRYMVHVLEDPLELPKEIAAKLFGSQHMSVTLSAAVPNYILKLEETDAREHTAFECQRSQYGSIFAFHGTSAENLHSILRCGLLILSNSSLQRNGAIFGEGIYLSSDPTVALGFSKAGKGWECSQFGQTARYLLLCEVALGGQVFSSGTSGVLSSKPNGRDLGVYIIVQNCELVKLRFMFVYVESSSNEVMLECIRHEQDAFHVLQGKSWGFEARKTNWCKAVVVSYAVLLIVIAILNSNCASKFISKLLKVSSL